MDASLFLENFERLAETVGSPEKLRELVFQLALRGKLVDQDPMDEPVDTLIAKVDAANIVNASDAKALSPIGEGEVDAALPASWIWTRLARLGEIAPRNESDDETLVSFAPMAAISEKYGERMSPEVRKWSEVKKGFTHFAEGDVLLAKITPCFQNGKSTVAKGVMNGIGAGTTELHVFRPVPETLCPEFVLIYLKSPDFLSRGISKMTGSAGQKRVPRDYFAYNPFPLPPLAEQRRIVAKVDQLLALCDELEARQQEQADLRTRLTRSAWASVTTATEPGDFATAWQRIAGHFDLLHDTPESIADLRQAILELAVTGRLVRQLPTDEPVQALLEDIRAERRQTWEAAELAKFAATRKAPKNDDWKQKYVKAESVWQPGEDSLPSTWGHIRFEEIVAHFQYGPRFGIEEYSSSGIPTIRTTDMTFAGRVNLFDSPKVSIPVESEGHWCLQHDDLLVTRTGATIGKCALYDIAWGKAIASAYLIRFRLTRKSVFPRFVLTFLMSPIGRCLLTSGSTEMAQPNVNATSILNFPLPLPPLAEQRRIVARVDDLFALCDRLESQLAASQAAGEKLLASMVHHLLNAAPTERTEEPPAPPAKRPPLPQAAPSPVYNGLASALTTGRKSRL